MSGCSAMSSASTCAPGKRRASTGSERPRPQPRSSTVSTPSRRIGSSRSSSRRSTSASRKSARWAPERFSLNDRRKAARSRPTGLSMSASIEEDARRMGGVRIGWNQEPPVSFHPCLLNGHASLSSCRDLAARPPLAGAADRPATAPRLPAVRSALSGPAAVRALPGGAAGAGTAAVPALCTTPFCTAPFSGFNQPRPAVPPVPATPAGTDRHLCAGRLSAAAGPGAGRPEIRPATATGPPPGHAADGAPAG